MDGEVKPQTCVVHCPPEIPVPGIRSSDPRQWVAHERIWTNPSMELA